MTDREADKAISKRPIDINIHASCVLIADSGRAFAAPRDGGILLIGESGTGKSELVLRLLAQGAQLVADDRTVLRTEEGVLIGSAPRALAGLLEVRGLGIVRLPYAEAARIVLTVQLGANAARLPERGNWPAPLVPPLAVPLLHLDAQTPSAAEKILLAAAAYAHGMLHAP